MIAAPSVVERILTWAVGDAAVASNVIGDLREERAEVADRRGRFAASIWYGGQALFIGLRYLGASLRRGLLGTAGDAILDVRPTLRSLLRAPVTSVAGVLSLAVGIGLMTAVAMVVNAIWLSPLPYPSAPRIADVEDIHPVEVCQGCSVGMSYDAFRRLEDDVSVFSQMAAMRGRSANLAVGDEARPLAIGEVSGDLAAVLGFRAALGRLIVAEDTRPGAANVLLLSHSLWRSRFASDPGIVGRTVDLDGTSHTVIGVLDGTARPLDRARAWVPLRAEDQAPGFEPRGLWVLGRLAEDVEWDVARDVIAAWGERTYADDPTLEPGWSARIQPLRVSLLSEAPPLSMMLALLVAGAIVLGIACLNLAAVLLARTVRRERELGVRLALGSSRWRLVRVVLSEAALLSAAAAVLGAAVAATVVQAVARRFAANLPGWMVLELDPAVLAGVTVVAVVAVLASGLLPLRRALGLEAADGVLGRIQSRASSPRLGAHDLLLGMQIALGVVLVGGCVTAVHQAARVSDFSDIGHRYEDLLSASVSLPEGRYMDTESAAELSRMLAQSVQGLSSVSEAAVSRTLFLGSWGSAEGGSPVRVEDAPSSVPDRVVPRHSLAVSAGYLELFQIPILAGRTILDSDGPGGEAVAVVSESAAGALWPTLDAQATVGRRFVVEGGQQTQWFRVVGVAGDVVVNVRSESRRATPRIYAALSQTSPTLIPDNPGGDRLSVVVDRAGTLTPGDVETAVRGVDPDLALAELISVEDQLRRWIAPTVLTAGLLAALAAVTVGLLMLGVFGTLSYRGAMLRTELGIRVAFGGRPADLVWTVAARTVRVVAISLALGVGFSFVMASSLQGGGIPLGGDDAWHVVVTVALLAVLCAVGCVAPVRQAIRVDPVESLTAE